MRPLFTPANVLVRPGSPWLISLLYQMERGGSPAATTNGLSRWWDPAGNDQHARSCRRRAHWCRPSSPLHGWSPPPIIADHSSAFWNLAQSLLAPVPPARRPQRDGPARAFHAPRVRVSRRGRSAQRPSCAACGSPVRCAAPGLPGLRPAWPAAGLPRECRTMDRPMRPCVWAPSFVRPHRRSFTLAPHHVHGLVVARRTTTISLGLWLCWPRGSSAWESGDTDLPLSGKARPADARRGAKDPRMRHTASTVLGSTSRPHAELCGLRRLQRSHAREVGG